MVSISRQMIIGNQFNFLLLNLKRSYENCPKWFSFIELVIYSGIFAFNVWIVPFWYWGIYLLNMEIPGSFATFFYRLWHETILVGAISFAIFSCLWILSFFIRKDSHKELGIRLDNIHKSGRECAVVSLISIAMIFSFFYFSFDASSFHGITSRLAGFSKSLPWRIAEGTIAGIGQQFLLQSVILIRLLKILGNRPLSLVAAAMLFAVAHFPNMNLMFLSFWFGLSVCILFVRNRNIFTLGIMHAILSMFVASFLVPGLINDLKIGPLSGDAQFVASIHYEGNKIDATPSEKMNIPVFVINKSAAPWNSKDKEYPTFISYHILDARGEVVSYDNIRTPFNQILKTGDSAKVELMVDAPKGRGEYYLEVDIVRERVAWFKNKGSKTIRIPLTIN